jgi:SSS family solute:Na+ symporter
VVAAFVAATIVSIASLLNSASTLITMDVVRHFKPHLSDARTVWVGRVSTAAMLIVAVMWAPQLQRFPSLWQYLQAVLAYAVPPVVAVFGVGMFWRGANAEGAAATLVLGSLCGFALFIVNGVLRLTHLHFIYAAPLLTFIDSGILVLVSIRTRDAATVIQTDAPSPAASWSFLSEKVSGLPVWKNYRWQAAALVALTAFIVIAFR